jgi:hypothetical protein
MAKFLLVGRKFINMDNINYIDLGEEESSTVTVYFCGAEDTKKSIQFTGDEATELWERLEEETTLGTSEPRP